MPRVPEILRLRCYYGRQALLSNIRIHIVVFIVGEEMHDHSALVAVHRQTLLITEANVPDANITKSMEYATDTPPILC